MAQHSARAVRRRVHTARRAPINLADTVVLTMPAAPPSPDTRPRGYQRQHARPVDVELRDQVATGLLVAGTLIGCALLAAYHSDLIADTARILYAFLVG